MFISFISSSAVREKYASGEGIGFSDRAKYNSIFHPFHVDKPTKVETESCFRNCDRTTFSLVAKGSLRTYTLSLTFHFPFASCPAPNLLPEVIILAQCGEKKEMTVKQENI